MGQPQRGDSRLSCCKRLVGRSNSVQNIRSFSFLLKVKFFKNVEWPILGLFIKTADGVTISGNNSKDWDMAKKFITRKTGDTTVVHFYFVTKLTSGEYLLSVGVAEEAEGEVIPLDRR